MFKKILLGIVGLLIVGGIISALNGSPAQIAVVPSATVEPTPKLTPKPTPRTTPRPISTPTPTATPVPTPTPIPTPVPTPEPPPLTISQSNAIASGRSYLDYTAFSRKGLIDQLVYEHYSVADATFAVDWIAPDWNEQAALMAQNYLNYTAFSRQALLDQLVYEGFTRAQAEYGVTAVGY